MVDLTASGGKRLMFPSELRDLVPGDRVFDPLYILEGTYKGRKTKFNFVAIKWDGVPPGYDYKRDSYRYYPEFTVLRFVVINTKEQKEKYLKTYPVRTLKDEVDLILKRLKEDK